MTATHETPNYGLPVYDKADKPSILGDYNTSIRKIDSAIFDAKKAAEQATASVAGAVSTANAANEEAQRQKINMRALGVVVESDAIALGQKIANAERSASSAVAAAETATHEAQSAGASASAADVKAQAASDLAKLKAPIMHADSQQTHGTGSGALYGHVKLSDVTNSNSSESGGIAATPRAVKTVQDSLTAEISKTNGISSTLSNLTAKVDKKPLLQKHGSGAWIVNSHHDEKSGHVMVVVGCPTNITLYAGQTYQIATLPANLRPQKAVRNCCHVGSAAGGFYTITITVKTDGTVHIGDGGTSNVSVDSAYYYSIDYYLGEL